jgi:hypothetical protein
MKPVLALIDHSSPELRGLRVESSAPVVGSVSLYLRTRQYDD